MLKKIALALCIVAALACQAAPRVPIGEVDGSNNLQPDTKMSVIAKSIVAALENYHYKKVRLDDSLSSVIFDRYIKSLDQGHNYLLAPDLKEFEQYRTTMDDDLKGGDLTAFFHIFNVFQSRYNARLNFSISQLAKPVDFTQGGTYVYDRSKLPFFASKADADAMWANRVKYDLLNLKIAGSDLDKSRETLRKRYQNLLSQASKTNNQDAFQIIMDSYTEAIDPHTNYFVPVRAQAFNEEMAKNFEGIGARLQLDNEVTKVTEIIGGGPAAKAGTLHAGDRIIGVAQGKDGEFVDVVGWRIDNVVQLIKGPKTTLVRLKIIPSGQELTSTPKIVEIVRDRVVLEDSSAKKTIKSVTSGGKTYKIGVIDIPDFYLDFKAAQRGDADYKSTTRDVRRILDTLKQQKVDAVIIDLRSNGGGSLSEAIDLGGLFIKSGPIVQTRDARKVDIDEDDDPAIAWEGPLGVMTDRFSASASEIFAGAMQDYGRAIIMGTQTYGKGTVQSVVDVNRLIGMADKLKLLAANQKSGEKALPANDTGLPEFGQLNFTMAKFYRVNGNSTQRKGVVPDVTFPMIYPAEKYGESSEPSALPWDSIKSSNFKAFSDLSAVRKQLEQLHEQRMKSSQEYKYLLEDIADFNRRESETSVSLNEARLKKERDDQEARTLTRNNQRRALKGLPPLKKGEVAPKDALDFTEDECLQVMADLIRVTNGEAQLTKNQKQP
jgi:carboxyl-terminal processing protease